MNTGNIEDEFHVSRYILVYKFILGLVEFVIGLSILFFGRSIFRMYLGFRSQEILENPHDLLVLTIERILPFFLRHRDYIIITLIVLGIIKMVGAVGLYYRKHWGLDLLVAITVFLLPFDTYSLVSRPIWYKFIYLAVNIFIALYLVNFRPYEYVQGFKKRIKIK